jgi:molybdate transport system permease protein
VEGHRTVTGPPGQDKPFLWALGILGGAYALLIVAMILADLHYTTWGHLWGALGSPEIRFAIRLSLLSSSASAILSLYVAIPLGYLLSRVDFPLKRLLDAVLDVPIILPPLVVGLSLLILFRAVPGLPYSWPSVVIAQFSVAAAFAVRTMRVTFDQISPRSEQVAMTLGCSRARAFFEVTLPEARRGILTAATLAWARSLGEFGPVLVFSGATRLRTEVLSTSVFLELSIGRLEAAVAVSIIMIAASVAVLVVVRMLGAERDLDRTVRP